MKSHRLLAFFTVLALAVSASAFATKRDMYQQDPGYRGIEFGAKPDKAMKVVDDSRAPILVYERQPDTTKMGLAQVDPAKYYFHKEFGFYKMTVDFRATQNEAVFDDIKRTFGQPTQVLPLGEQELLIWLRPDHTIEMTRMKTGSSSVKITSTKLAPQVGDQ